MVWPEGPALHGVTGQLLEMTLPVFGMSIARRPVRVPDLSSFRAVFVANSVGIGAVRRVDGTDLTTDPAAIDVIRQAHDAVPWDPI